jgi:hypothetical protein
MLSMTEKTAGADAEKFVESVVQGLGKLLTIVANSGSLLDEDKGTIFSRAYTAAISYRKRNV